MYKNSDSGFQYGKQNLDLSFLWILAYVLIVPIHSFSLISFETHQILVPHCYKKNCTYSSIVVY